MSKEICEALGWDGTYPDSVIIEEIRRLREAAGEEGPRLDPFPVKIFPIAKVLGHIDAKGALMITLMTQAGTSPTFVQVKDLPEKSELVEEPARLISLLMPESAVEDLKTILYQL